MKEKQRKFMRLFLCLFSLLYLSALTCYALPQNSSKRLSLDLKSATLREFFDAVKKQTGLSFIYNSDQSKSMPRITIHSVDQTVDNVLNKVMSSLGCTYEIKGEIVMIIQQQKNDTRTLTGYVYDNEGGVLPGANVFIKNTKYHVVTNVEGYYSISIPTSACSVSYSYVGMKTHMISFGQGTSNLKKNITLISDSQIDDVVITGIFKKPKESFTGAAVKVTQDEIKAAGNRTILQSLSNLDPSFVIAENNSTGSNPNSLPEIRLRGVSSIPAVSQLQNNTRAELCTPLFILDGFEITLEQMMDLNNDQVESVTILKDASATAIYGSRGANGVVVITSVKPKQGRLKVSYSANLNLEIPSLSSYNLMNASQKLQLEQEAGMYDSSRDDADYLLKKSYAEKLQRVKAGANTDWLRIPVQIGIGQNHYLGIGGGDESFRYNIGVSYNNIKGAMKGSDRSTTYGSVTLSYFHKQFSFSNNTNFSFNNSKQSPYGSFSNYAKMNPYWEPLDSNGRIVTQFETSHNEFFSSAVKSPYYAAKQGDFNKSDYTNITNNTSFSYRPIPEFQATLNFNFGKTFNETDNFVSPANTTSVIGEQKYKGSRTYYNGSSQSWAVSTTLSYFKKWDKHVLTVGANYEMRENKNRSQQMRVIGYVNETINSLGNGQAYSGARPSSSDALSRHLGVTGTVNYNFDNRYYVDSSYRLDGSSSFGSDTRFAPFWSVGCGWTISNEKFIRENLPFISSLRARYSYGVTGSLAFDPWQSQGSYYIGGGYAYNGAIGAVVRGLENKSLKWQTTNQHNFGFDLGLFDGFLSLSGNFYRKVTSNAITDMSLPLSSGFESYTGNSGKILNTGSDFYVSIYLLKIPKKQMSWNVVIGTSHNKNKLLTLSDAVKRQMNEMKADRLSSYNLYYVYEEGSSVDAIYAVPTLGVDPATGKMVYLYKDGSQSYDYDVNQRVVCGDRMPKFDGRLSTSFNWRGFSFNAGFTIRTGGQKYNYTFANKIENVDFHYNLDKRVLNQRWRKPGDETAFAGFNSTTSYIIDRYVQDEKTFSCNNINISYDFRQKWVKNLGFSSLRATGSIANVFYLSTIRQERGTSYPYAIQPTFGFACSF